MSIYIFPENHLILGNSKYLGIELKRQGIPFKFISFELAERPLLRHNALPFVALKDFNEKFEELIKPGDVCFFSTTPAMRIEKAAYKRILHNTMHIQMWHGFPMKKIANGALPYEEREEKREATVRNRTNKLFFNVMSELERERMVESFFYDDYRVNGSARSDMLFRPMLDEDYVNVPLAQYDKVREYREVGARVVTIMFTWTSDQSIYKDEYDEIYRMAARNPDMLFIIKPHMNDKEIQLEAPTNMIVLGRGADPYPFVKLSHAVVTDLSSIGVDSLPLKRQGKTEIFFYHKKLNKYIEWWARGTYNDDYEEIGRVIYDLEDLTKTDLVPVIEGTNFDKYLVAYDGKSCERIDKSFDLERHKPKPKLATPPEEAPVLQEQPASPSPS